jgi:hypothetical protein
MITLRYGRRKPENGNKGSIVFSALSDNIDLDDSHDHNDVNSPKIKSFNLNKGSRSIAAGDYVLDPDSGWYAAEVAMPSGYSLDTCNPYFFVVGGDYGGMTFTPTWVRNGDAFNLIVWMPVAQPLSMVCI